LTARPRKPQTLELGSSALSPGRRAEGALAFAPRVVEIAEAQAQSHPWSGLSERGVHLAPDREPLAPVFEPLSVPRELATECTVAGDGRVTCASCQTHDHCVLCRDSCVAAQRQQNRLRFMAALLGSSKWLHAVPSSACDSRQKAMPESHIRRSKEECDKIALNTMPNATNHCRAHRVPASRCLQWRLLLRPANLSNHFLSIRGGPTWVDQAGWWCWRADRCKRCVDRAKNRDPLHSKVSARDHKGGCDWGKQPEDGA
jgi:hypothetical protein